MADQEKYVWCSRGQCDCVIIDGVWAAADGACDLCKGRDGQPATRMSDLLEIVRVEFSEHGYPVMPRDQKWIAVMLMRSSSRIAMARYEQFPIEMTDAEIAEEEAMSRFYDRIGLFLEDYQSDGEPTGYECCGGTGEEFNGAEFVGGVCDCSIVTDWDGALRAVDDALGLFADLEPEPLEAPEPRCERLDDDGERTRCRCVVVDGEWSAIIDDQTCAACSMRHGLAYTGGKR